MAVAAFDGGVDGLRIGNVEAKMAIDTIGGGWQQQVSAFDGGDGRRWLLDGTFRFSVGFVGGRNPGPDSCSDWILADSSSNIPDVLFFLRAGTLLP